MRMRILCRCWGVADEMGTVELFFVLVGFAAVHSVVPLADEVLNAAACSDEPAPGDLTLDSLLQSGTVESGVTYRLSEGEHCVRRTVMIRDLKDLSFRGPAQINCTSDNGIALYNISNLSFHNLTIDGCGIELHNISEFLSTLRKDIDFFFKMSNASEQYVAVLLGDILNFQMEDSVIRNTLGLGLLGINVLGNSVLTNITVQHNVPSAFNFNRLDSTNERIGGGLFFAYHDYLNESKAVSSSLEISDSEFMNNSYSGYAPILESYYRSDGSFTVTGDDLLVGGGGGLTLILAQLQYPVHATIRNSIFQNNTALYGGGLHVQLFAGVLGCLMQLDGCIFERNGLMQGALPESYPLVGSAIIVLKDYNQPDFSTKKISSHVIPSNFSILNTQFLSNQAYTGTLVMISLYQLAFVQGSFEVENCTFVDNGAFSASAMFFQEDKASVLQRGTTIAIRNVECSHNVLYNTSNTVFLYSRMGVSVFSSLNVTVAGNTNIAHNSGTGLVALSASLYVKDTLTFLNNSGTYGGAMGFMQASYLVIQENSSLVFINNSASVAGGALFNSLQSFYSPLSFLNCAIHFGDLDLYCLFNITSKCKDITSLGAELVFKGNKAPMGSMLYGFFLNYCPWITKYKEVHAPGENRVDLLQLLYKTNTTFMFDAPPNNPTQVSTPTVDILVHHVDSFNTSGSSMPISVAPGLRTGLNVTCLDAFNHVVSTVVTTKSSRPDSNSMLGDTNLKFISQNIVELAVYGSPSYSDLNVTLLTVGSFAVKTVPVKISECPDGYTLENNTCSCSKFLMDKHVTCTENGSLLVPLGSWVGRENGGDTLLQSSCPVDYCALTIATVDATDPMSYDSQCNRGYNRSGVACGSCVQGHSVVFGSNRCFKCSNSFLLLIFLFAAYGVFLMAVIVLLQITISGGFLNGVLFFSNILTVYAPHFAFNSNISRYFILFFWLSLKLGFETCFFDGMTALSSTALHFVFPFYLYFLLLLIVLLARWSSRFFRWLTRRGFSPPKLLATVMVMTYSSLLESCIEVLSLVKVAEMGKKPSYRWRYDPSLHYFQSFHTPLAVFAILLLVFFLIPAPLAWMVPRWTLSRFKPLYDAVWAPLKPNFRFWVSLRLFLRFVPLIFLNFTSPPLTRLLLALFLLVLLFVQATLQPFRGLARNAFDGFFQTMLLFITMVSLYFSTLNQEQSINLSGADFDINKTNAALHQFQQSQDIFLWIALVLSYAGLVLLLFFHILLMFPWLLQLLVSTWHYITCKKCTVQIEYPRKHSSLLDGDSPTINYGSTVSDSEHSADSEPPPKPVATFSELREPLLESGTLEITRANTN